MSTVEQEVRGREVGDRLGDLVAGLEVAPADWIRVRHGVVRARRRRRAVLGSKVAGGTLAVVALIGTLQVGLLPYPSWAPAVPVSGLDGPSELAEAPTRGDLAGDDAFLAGVREQVVGRAFEEGGAETWAVRSPAEVDVLFAGDVGFERWALVEAPYRYGLLEERLQVWVVGPAEAQPRDLVVLGAGAQQLGDVAAIETGGWAPRSQQRGLLVVSAAADREVTVRGPEELTADGGRERASTTARTRDGVLWQPIGVGEHLVEVDGRTVFSGSTDQEGDAATAWSGRGTRLDDRTLDQVGRDATSALRLGPMPGTMAWSDGRGEPALLVLQADSGARLLVMGHVVGPPPWRTAEAVEELGSDRVSADVLQVRPAGTDDLAAWQLGETSWTQGAADPPRTRHTLSDSDESWTGVDDATEQIAVVGPAEATEAELLDARGAVVARFVLEEGGGSASVTDAGAVATARFLGPGGAALGTTPVVAWTAAGGAPQLSP